MKKTLIATIVLAIGLLPLTANAAIVSVAGPDSNFFNTSPAIIPAPENVLNSVAFNSGMEGFDEAQGVVTTVAHNIDSGGPIPAGTLVSSHMIFLNKQDGVPGHLIHGPVVWTFDGPVVGVMSDYSGNFEVASTFELGAPGTNYTVGAPGQVAPYNARGMIDGEQGDSYNVIGNQITVTMRVGQPGDWIRVITLAPITEIEVEIDIKPGSFPSSINLRKKGVTPVAIHTTPDFDATTVDPLSVRLNDCGPPVNWEAYDCDELPNPLYGDPLFPDEPEMIGDGDIDLVLYFDTPELADERCLEVGDVEAILTGETFDGIPIEGTGDVSIVKGPKT